MEYVRKRRLTEAGKALLHSNQRILDIALDWQYDSQEAFTRAFKRAYGVPPGTFRRRKSFTPLRLPLSLLDLQPLNAKGALMETRIIDLPAMQVVGMAYIGKNEHQDIPALWDVLPPTRRGSDGQNAPRCRPRGLWRMPVKMVHSATSPAARSTPVHRYPKI